MKVPIEVTVNGRQYRHEVEPRLLLVDYLRETLNLTGAKIGCDTSQCGSCTVEMNGSAMKSCTCLAVQADGSYITTIEGLAGDDVLHPIQGGVLEQAWPPVRLLHSRDDHGHQRATAEEPVAVGGRG